MIVSILPQQQSPSTSFAAAEEHTEMSTSLCRGLARLLPDTDRNLHLRDADV